MIAGVARAFQFSNALQIHQRVPMGGTLGCRLVCDYKVSFCVVMPPPIYPHSQHAKSACIFEKSAPVEWLDRDQSTALPL